jgi:two-component system sensor histidine kinase AtoS
MPQGGRLVLSVEPDVAGAQDEVVLSVQDAGRGIPAEELDSLFQPFRSSFERGTGLGLAIVHRIVSDYGGVIQVSSTVGVGTTVRVRLPIRTSSVIAVAAGPRSSPLDVARPSAGSGRPELVEGRGGPLDSARGGLSESRRPEGTV